MLAQARAHMEEQVGSSDHHVLPAGFIRRSASRSALASQLCLRHSHQKSRPCRQNPRNKVCLPWPVLVVLHADLQGVMPTFSTHDRSADEVRILFVLPGFVTTRVLSDC